MTDEDKVLALHDYLVMNVTYDMEIYKGEGNYDMITHSAYAALVNEVAVCSGYALAFKYLLNHLDIDCICFTSNAMKHAWNGVKLDDKWYHIDATWDDPEFIGGGASGYVDHDYFLLSDETMRNGKNDLYDDSHHGWAENVVCDSKKYETGYPFSGDKDVVSGFVYENGGFYYIKYLQKKDGKLYYRAPELIFSNFDGSTEETIKKFSVNAKKCFMQYHDGELFFYCWEPNAANSIYEYNVGTDEIKEIAQSSISDVEDYKLGLDIKNDKLLWYAHHDDSVMTEYDFEKDIEDITIGKPILKGAFHVDKFTAREAIENGLKMSISNHTEKDKEYDVYFAYYKDGILMGISSTRITVPKHSHKIAILEKLAKDGKDADDVRIFMMNEVFAPEVDEKLELK